MTPLLDVAQLFRFPYLSGIVKRMSFKIVVFFVIIWCGKKAWNVRYLVWCTEVFVCSRLVVSVCFLVVFSRFLVYCGRLWSFVVVSCVSNYGFLVLFGGEKNDFIYKRIRCVEGVKSGITHLFSHDIQKSKLIHVILCL